MRLGKTIIAIFVFCLLLLTIDGTAVLAAEVKEVEIEAELVEFDPVAKVYKASGGVTFTNGDFRVEAETVHYNQETALITAGQGVKLWTADGTWEGESLIYSFRTEQGTLTSFTGKGGELYLGGKTGELRGDEILVQDATFTNCELAVPCLKIKAGRVRLVNNQVQVRRGWLYLKNLPVLPLPPLTFATDQFEDWPQLEVGVKNTRGTYLLGKVTNKITDNVTMNYGVGVGTKNWWNAQAGLRWDLSANLFLNSSLTWEEYFRGNASLTYDWAPVQVTAGVQRDWDELTSGENRLSVRGPLTKKSNLELSYTTSFDEKTNGLNQRQDYGLLLTGRWLPGFTLGAGLYYGQGDLKTDSLNSWYLRATWSGGINIARTWRIETAGETRWQEGIDPLWVQKQVKLVKDLHCIKLGLGYDLLDESISFNLGYNW